MIARAITAIIGVVIGLFATFAVFSAILGGLDNFYLLTQDACNYGSHNSPKRALRIAPENTEHPGDADEIDWTRDGLDLREDDDGRCEVAGGYDDALVYLTPTGDELDLSGTYSEIITRTLNPLPADEASSGAWSLGQGEAYVPSTSTPDINLSVGVWREYDDVYTFHYYTAAQVLEMRRFQHGTGFEAGDQLETLTWSLPDTTPYEHAGVVADADYFWVSDPDAGLIRAFDRDGGGSAVHTINLHSVNPKDLAVRGDHIYALSGDTAYAYSLTSRSSDSAYNLTLPDDDNEGIWIDVRGRLWLVDSDYNLSYQADFDDPTSDSRTFPYSGRVRVRGATLILDDDHRTIAYFTGSINDFIQIVPLSGPAAITYDVSTTVTNLGLGLPWIPAEDVFTAQERLVTLLAVIAAIGMPIGAMTAIVFFGQAVLSSGMSGQGASQVLVAIAAVVIILVSIQMFQQFAGFLGTAFDAVNGDRFVVFDETLGSLAETIAEFWGVLAFAGFINIATIVWRNYSGNFSIGGNQGGL